MPTWLVSTSRPTPWSELWSRSPCCSATNCWAVGQQLQGRDAGQGREGWQQAGAGTAEWADEGLGVQRWCQGPGQQGRGSRAGAAAGVVRGCCSRESTPQPGRSRLSKERSRPVKRGREGHQQAGCGWCRGGSSERLKKEGAAKLQQGLYCPPSCCPIHPHPHPHPHLLPYAPSPSCPPSSCRTAAARAARQCRSSTPTQRQPQARAP